MTGWIAAPRDIWDHPVLKRGPMTEPEAWLWMVSQANFKPQNFWIGSTCVKVGRGEFITTLRDLTHNMLWSSDKRTRGFLKRLTDGRMIVLSKAGPKNAPRTHVTICNYDNFTKLGRTGDAGQDEPRTHEGRAGDVEKNKETREHDGGDARSARDQTDLDFRDQILHALGFDPGEAFPDGRTGLGNFADMIEARRWITDLGLTEDHVIRVLTEVTRRKRGGPAAAFKYFTPAMQRVAAELQKPKLTPQKKQDASNGRSPAPSSPDRVLRVVTAAARGTSGQDWS